MKMTVGDQIKILDRKIRAKKAQYNLDREAAKISALSSGDLEVWIFDWGSFRILTKGTWKN